MRSQRSHKVLLSCEEQHVEGPGRASLRRSSAEKEALAKQLMQISSQETSVPEAPPHPNFHPRLLPLPRKHGNAPQGVLTRKNSLVLKAADDLAQTANAVKTIQRFIRGFRARSIHGNYRFYEHHNILCITSRRSPSYHAD